MRGWWWVVAGLVALARGAGGSVNCRVACRECRDGREPREMLTVYCAMCEECKDRRREREWLIARKQDLEKEAELRKSSTSPMLRHGGLRSTSRHECPTPPPCEEERHQCPPCPAPCPEPPPQYCPPPPPCEEETTPRPTCPPIPQCVKMQRWTPQVRYQPTPPPTPSPPPAAPACAPCPNMCPCPGSGGTESVFIGVPDQLLQT